MAVKGDTKKIAMAADAVAATDSDIGKVIGADGVVYASVADAEDAQTTAYAMIAYINSAGSFGLAIAVGDADGPCAWDDAKYAATSWAAARPAGFGDGNGEPATAISFVTIYDFRSDGCGGFTLSLDVEISQGDYTSLANDFNSTLKVASTPTLEGMKAIAAYDNVTSANQVLATNGVVYAESGNLATIDLFLPAPSARSSFYKLFALEELPAKE